MLCSTLCTLKIMGRPKKEQDTKMVKCKIVRMEDSLREHKVGDIVELEVSLCETLESWGFVDPVEDGE